MILKLGTEESMKLALAGGKGASLGRLVRADFPVPPGFVVTTQAYTAYLAANDLQPRIDGILNGVDFAYPEQVERETARIRDLFRDAAIPKRLAGEIREVYRSLGDDPFVAVRSSGTAEDLAGASFAGQYDTYLDIRGAPALLDALRRCWASMWTGRAVAYRHRHGFDGEQPSIAVVVQAMVEADVSGVMFVGNPMNARADEIVVNASWGLGEAVVSGLVNPDEYILDAKTGKPKARRMGDKALTIRRGAGPEGGTVRVPTEPALQARLTLNDEQLEELAALGAKATAFYGGLPQDLEWALSGGRFCLLQSRPITGVDFSR
ncbi:MAG: hypothetical protein OXP09_17290 [Gammaproteobacteria bacterium]|nr:hypothetical protein [Gammaproteobacteria bacterium]